MILAPSFAGMVDTPFLPTEPPPGFAEMIAYGFSRGLWRRADSRILTRCEPTPEHLYATLTPPATARHQPSTASLIRLDANEARKGWPVPGMGTAPAGANVHSVMANVLVRND